MTDAPVALDQAVATRTAAVRRSRHPLLTAISYGVLTIGGLTMLVPFAWMLSTSLKSQAAVFVFPPVWIPSPVSWRNYLDVVQIMPFGRFFLNTLAVATAITVLHLVTSSLAGYSFARLRFPGRDALFLGYLATLMVPGQVTLIPNFLIAKYLGWIDTYQGLIIPQIFSAFGTFLLRQYFLGIPRELEDAARIDGSSSFGIYYRIIVPLSGPALATLAVFTFTGQWNSFLWPLIITNDVSMRTLTVGLRTLEGQFTVQWPLLMAGTVISLAPLVAAFLAAQRYFVQGIALTGLGGR